MAVSFFFLSRRRGLTLMEVMVTVSLVALIGMTVFSTLNNGLKLWQVVNVVSPDGDVAIFFEKVTQEFENVFVLDRASFQGDNATVTFPTSLKGLRRSGTWSMGAIRYAFDQRAQVLTRTELTISDIFQDRVPSCAVVFDHVDQAVFSYYYFDTASKEYAWSLRWPPELSEGAVLPLWPLAVKLTFQWLQKGHVYDFENIFPIPLAQS
jgi:prepilin-type N-terminal cleavage/methylation domain-containing protein